MKWLDKRRERKLQLVKAQTKKLKAATAYYNRMAGSRTVSGSKTPGGLSNSGQELSFDHYSLRKNARDAMFDSMVGRGIATRFADTIADVGLKAKFEPDAEALKLTPERAEKMGRELSYRFDLWMRSKDSSLDGVNTGYQNQWLYSFAQQRDNDIYVRLHYNTTDKDLISPLQIQFMDPDQLAGYCYTSTEGRNQTANKGINYDSKGREKSFDFLVVKEDGEFDEITIPKFGRRTKRQYVIHGFRPEYAGQKQGMSLLTHILQEMEDITTLKTAHLQKAINQSNYVFYTKPSQDAPASAGPDDYANAAVEVIDDFLGAREIDEAAAESTEALNTLQMNILNEATIRQPGTVWNTSLTAGEDMRAVEQTAPADGFGDFVDSLVSYMSSSCGMPIEVLKQKFGQNYSASRATLVLFWRIINMWRQEMADDFLNVLVKMWVSEEIAAGRVKCPGWSDPRIRQSWLKVRWIGSAEPDIDPKKSAEAAGLRATLGHETLDDGALKYNGSDGTANRAKLRKEIPELEVGPWNKAYGSNVAEEGNTDFEGDEDDEEPTDAN